MTSVKINSCKGFLVSLNMKIFNHKNSLPTFKSLITLPQSVKEISTLLIQNYPFITRIPPPQSLNIPHPPPLPTLPANASSQFSLINSNATVELSSINTIHVKQQHNVGFLIFKFNLKYMLGNVYINKIHTSNVYTKQVNIVGQVFPILSISLLYMLLFKQKNSISISQLILSF